jgi:hypothetical protein
LVSEGIPSKIENEEEENGCGELSGVLCEAVSRIDIAEIAGELSAAIVLLLVTTQPKSEATEHP